MFALFATNSLIAINLLQLDVSERDVGGAVLASEVAVVRAATLLRTTSLFSLGKGKVFCTIG